VRSSDQAEGWGYYKRAWDEVVAPEFRAGEPPPGTSRERFLRMLDAADYLAAHIQRNPDMDRSLPSRRDADAQGRFVDLPGGQGYAGKPEQAQDWVSVGSLHNGDPCPVNRFDDDVGTLRKIGPVSKPYAVA
jgi:hypothetical protein